LNEFEIKNPFKILSALKASIPSELLKNHSAENRKYTSRRREVILSEYLIGK
jgi:hypothetical protein